MIDLDETPGGKLVGGPPCGTIGRIAHQQHAARREYRGSEWHHHCRSTETPGRHDIGDQTEYIRHPGSIDLGHHHPLGDTECTNGIPEQVGSLGPSFHEHQLEIGSAYTDDQCRQSTARAQIDDTVRIEWQRGNEVVGVRNCAVEVDRADRSPSLEFGKNPPQFVVVRHAQAR